MNIRDTSARKRPIGSCPRPGMRDGMTGRAENPSSAQRAMLRAMRMERGAAFIDDLLFPERARAGTEIVGARRVAGPVERRTDQWRVDRPGKDREPPDPQMELDVNRLPVRLSKREASRGVWAGRGGARREARAEGSGRRSAKLTGVVESTGAPEINSREMPHPCRKWHKRPRRGGRAQSLAVQSGGPRARPSRGMTTLPLVLRCRRARSSRPASQREMAVNLRDVASSLRRDPVRPSTGRAGLPPSPSPDRGRPDP
jgi:hypothetical protein